MYRKFITTAVLVLSAITFAQGADNIISTNGTSFGLWVFAIIFIVPLMIIIGKLSMILAGDDLELYVDIKGDQKIFLIAGSETPRYIPAWVWALVIGFVGWAIYYAVIPMNMSL